MKYKIENLKKEKEKILAQYIALKNAWENVTFPTKKDGTPFKSLAKNFSGARYYIGAYSITNCNYMLTVDTIAKYNNGTTEYISDDIYCSENLKYMKDPINPDNIRKQSVCVEDQYLYDLNEIKNILIPRRIKYYADQIHKLEAELQDFDKLAVAVDETIKQLKNDNGELFMKILKKSL